MKQCRVLAVMTIFCTITAAYSVDEAKTLPRNSTWTFGVSMGSGQGLFSGNLNRVLGSFAPIAAAFDLGYLNWRINLHGSFILPETKSGFDTGSIYVPEGSSTTGGESGASLGYCFWLSNNVSLLPTVGVSEFRTKLGYNDTPIQVSSPYYIGIPYMFSATYNFSPYQDNGATIPWFNTRSYFIRLQIKFTHYKITNEHTPFSGDLMMALLMFGATFGIESE